MSESPEKGQPAWLGSAIFPSPASLPTRSASFAVFASCWVLTLSSRFMTLPQRAWMSATTPCPPLPPWPMFAAPSTPCGAKILSCCFAKRRAAQKITEPSVKRRSRPIRTPSDSTNRESATRASASSSRSFRLPSRGISTPAIAPASCWQPARQAMPWTCLRRTL